VAQTATALVGVASPIQAAVPEPSLDAFAQALFEEPKQMVDAERFNRGFVRAGGSTSPASRSVSLPAACSCGWFGG
jgi:hypothetical protein